MSAMERHLKNGGQVIVFLNRRGYAPTLFCNACGWIASCAHCDARMTLHRRAAELRCHHCGARAKYPPSARAAISRCIPSAKAPSAWRRPWCDCSPMRRWRVSTATRRARATRFRRARSGSPGRGANPGRHADAHQGSSFPRREPGGHPGRRSGAVRYRLPRDGAARADHHASRRTCRTRRPPGRSHRTNLVSRTPAAHALDREGYEGFAATALEERREASWPPYSRLALLRAEAKDREGLDAYLRAAAARAGTLGERASRAGPRGRLDRAARRSLPRAPIDRKPLARSAATLLDGLAPASGFPARPQGVRWSIDVDPLEVD